MFAVRITCLSHAGVALSRGLRAVRGPLIPRVPETEAFEEVGRYESGQPAADEPVRQPPDERFLPKSIRDYEQAIAAPISQPQNPLFLNVAVIGMPNAGKSTLMNKLVGAKISAVSKKVHTTRRNVIGTLVHESTQIVFSDSPGLVTKSHCAKHHLEHTFVTQPTHSVSRADLILTVVDVSNPRERKKLNPGIIDKLTRFADKPSILVLNKVDVMSKKRMLFDVSHQLTDGRIAGQEVADRAPQTLIPTIRRGDVAGKLKAAEKRIRNKGYICDLPKLSGAGFEVADEDEEPEVCSWPHFSRVFMVSALTEDGIDDLKQYLLSAAKPGDWKFPAHVITTQNPESLVIMTVKEKLLDLLSNELPYVIRMRIASWCVMRTGTLCVAIDLLVPEQRYIPQVLGENGKIIAEIANESRQEISNAFRCDVSLKLVVKCTKVLK